ncbi:MAG TPA: hypothetical protein VG329_04015 [Candidatus Dormibacteraeota bacterium]|jgi:hypothetical protein|nr:hypothetical protein [Candidatus Dormibacteraeota bacterium]
MGLIRRDGRVRPDLVVLGLILGAMVVGTVMGYTSAQQPDAATLIIGLGLAGVLASIVWRRPDLGLLGLAALMPFYPTIFGRLLVWGVPVSILAPLRFWKEVVVISLGAKVLVSGMHRRTAIDNITIAFILLTALYIVLPLGPSLYARLLGAREIASYLFLFLAARHLPLGERLGPRLVVTLLAAGAVLGGLAFWDHFDNAGWSAWISASGLQEYQEQVFNIARIPGAEIGHLGDQEFIRTGSLFLNPLSLAFYLLIPVGIIIGRVVSGRARRFEVVLGIVCAAGVLLTLTRSAITAMPLMLLVALVLGRRSTRRMGGMLLAAGILWPVASAVALGSHLSDAIDTGATSTQGHLEQLSTDMALLLAHPGGSGLATGGGLASQRLSDAASITAESWYFQVGLEIGVLGMLLFIALLWLCLAELWRRTRESNPLAMEAMVAAAGLSVVGVVLRVYGDQVVSYSLWTLIGLALAVPLVAPEAEAPTEVAATEVVVGPRWRGPRRARV